MRTWFAACACSSGAAGRQSPTLPTASSDLRLLPLPRRAAPACGARARAGLPGALLALRDGSARRARVRGAAQPRAFDALGLGADDGRGAEARPRGRGGIRRRLRDRALVAPAAEPRRRRVLDRRHRGHPADAPRAGPRRAFAVRLHGDRAARAARAAPLRAHGAAVRAGARRGVRDRRLQRVRDGRAFTMAPRAGSRRARRVRAALASTSRRSGRRAAPPDVDVVSIGADPHRDFSLLLDVARAMPTRASSS